MNSHSANQSDDILIVDDTLHNLKLLAQILTERGYQVRAALSGPRALAAIQSAPPSLILLDIMMPEMDGYELCRRLKADLRTCDIPVLFISALSETEDKVRGFAVGGLDYITKPFQPEEVLARVETHLKLQRLQYEIRIQEEITRELLNASPNAAYLVSADGTILTLNELGAKELGRSIGELQSKRIWDFLHPEVAAKRKACMEQAILSSMPVRFEDECAGRCMDNVIYPIFDDMGRAERIAIYTRDITEHKRIEEVLLRAKEAAEAATKAKSEFLANMSHEIRTPMNAVIGMACMLSSENLTTDQRDYVETIRSAGEALLIIINDILDLSKIEGGKMDLECQPFNLYTCVKESLDLVATNAAIKGLNLRYAIDDDTPKVILGDPTRLRQILVNLLSNAVKFTEKGEVAISVTGRKLEGSSYEVSFAISDTGIGIPADKMGRLFRSFSQVDASTTRRYGGTGLGLTICKRLVELMDGKIWVKSEMGKGSTFYFTIQVEPSSREPVNIAKLNSISKQHADTPSNTISELCILLAEDNVINQKVTQRMLGKLGCRADIVTNGQEVLHSLERQHYDVILMDILMPEMDGLEATKAIRQRWPNGPKIIAMTASVLNGDREMCLNAGMDIYITKPTKLEELKAALEFCSKHLKDLD